MNYQTFFLRNILLLVLALTGCAQDEEVRTWNISGVSTRDIIVAVQAAGIIEPVTTVEIKSKASGEILDIRAETGDLVEAGDLLVQIDKRTPRNSLAQSEAELEAARARRDIAMTQRDRSKKLFESGTLNQVDYETSILEYANSRAEVVRAEVAVENARIALDDTEVRAPIQGTLIQRDVEVGQVISSPTQDVGGGTVLLKMADLRSVQVRALVDESDIGKILPGQQTIVTVAAYPNQPFDGTVQKIEPQAEDEEAVTLFAVIVTIENKLGLLRPGMNAEVDVDIASRYGVPAIPTMALRTVKDIEAAALFAAIPEETILEQLRSGGMQIADIVSEASEDAPPANGSSSSDSGESTQSGEPLQNQGYLFGGQYWVFVMRDDLPFAQNIQTGLTDLDYSEVISGLSADEEIILLPSSDLIMSQDRFKKWMGEVVGVPGMSSDEEEE
ncbi:MAG: efflux RND transporter periplasmic adaptor subunit [Gammaproteobacteria bacterium]|jgi:HlyD family secretion protein|nr:efflux RND transporter periplasmic adaptor subunit [Gammaproteobacteria bacterium]MDP7093219.1 efflux RND transporter periplasmic adaptor subunit [Gammaproteobacteria bacterium]MDP7271313.1 efflux RND transporter periplasmic adaptor subunit [Gammaproteobacteria bacterium]HJP05024.1 efflux RND transporter periplasmic adaptor subunit [Gammaproteobacteria bacterium]